MDWGFADSVLWPVDIQAIKVLMYRCSSLHLAADEEHAGVWFCPFQTLGNPEFYARVNVYPPEFYARP